MKKLLILFLVLLLTLGALSLSACSLFGKKGDTGAAGVGIASIEKSGTEGLVDTYTITLTDGSTTTFTVTNGKDGENGKDGKDGVNADGTSVDPDAPTPDDYFRFTLLEDDTYEISARYVDMPPRTVIPATHEGKAVTSIQDRGFEDRRSIEEIVIPASITNIDGGAFEECDGVSIVNYKGDMASWCAITDSGRSELLYWADSLYINGSKVEGELVIPDGVTSIGEYAINRERDIGKTKPNTNKPLQIVA